MAQISLTSTLLRRILKTVAPATAAQPEVPSHFSETVRVQCVEDQVLFTCADGFHLHEVEMFTGVNYSGDDEGLVLSVGWLQGILKEIGRTERWLEISAEKHPDTAKIVEMWENRCWFASFYGASSDQPRNEHPLRFDIGGKWPNTANLIDYDTIEDSVGINPGYFKDMVLAALTWWDKDSPDASFPLIVQQMHPQKVSKFTLRNGVGRLTVAIMPKIMLPEEF